MLVEVANARSKLLRAGEAEERRLRRVLSFEQNGWRKRGEESVCMLEAATKEFPTGFLPMVRDSGAQDGVKLELLDTPKAPCAPVEADLSRMSGRYAFQRDVVQDALAKQRGILWCPTGSGKTDIGIGIVQSLPCAAGAVARPRTVLPGSVPCRKEASSWQKAPYRS